MLIKTQFATIAIAVFQAVEAVTSFETRKTHRFACFQPPKECLERFIQSSQQLLHTRRVELAERIRIGAAQIPKMCPLLRIRDAFARLSIHRDPLLKGRVVHPAPLPQQVVQQPSLRVGRVQAIFVSADHTLPPFYASVYRCGCHTLHVEFAYS